MNNKALFKLGYGLYVLTAKENGKDNGCIINTCMQVTSSPAVCVIGVNKQNYTHDMIMRTKEFNISMLSTDASFAVFERFGFKSGRDSDKFKDFSDTERAENGITYLSKMTNAYLSCHVLEATDYGTHTLFKAEITAAEVLSERESVTYNYYQAYIKPKPPKTEKKGWRCKICGYVYEGEELPEDFICPICKHPASDFEKINNNTDKGDNNMDYKGTKTE